MNCMCATSEEAERMAEVSSAIAELAHQKKRNSSFRTAVENLSENADSEDQESGIVGTHNHLR